jgi:sigma-B regulation protein RsbU (phosphoserine phosphatase)
MSRIELAAVFIGVTLLALGVVSTAAATLRLRRGSITLLMFGLWCGLYGARLLALQPAVRSAIAGTPGQWARFVTIVTYTINVPITIFVASLMGVGWRHSIRWLVAAVSAFAVVAVAMDLVTGVAGSANQANAWVVLATIAIGISNIIYTSAVRGIRTPLTEPIVIVGGLVIVLFVINENAGQFIARGVNIEPIGVLVFVMCLGYAVARSVFRKEADFVGVQRELETARQIQASHLPRRVPRPLGLDVAVRYVPMAAVAGDLYDFVEIGPSSLGILVADVMGHGIPAAMVASMVKLAFSEQTASVRDPAAVLTSMNQILCRHLERSYVTAVYAVLDTEAHRVTVATAGHPPPLVQRGSEAGSLAETEHGLILGFLPDARYTNTCVEPFVAGDRILLYSDGVLEARNATGEFFDSERVVRWLSTIEPTSAERFADTALDELTRWSGRGQFDDDVTFVVAEAR